ncbi:hypothetical protein CPB86DRAFT_705997 [Serendipita vermifera]|nr:hypothetical protein CPB86DRAFT_705997 [Serendipita vermifera]
MQRSLEHVVASRLVETFLSLQVWDKDADKRGLSATSPLHSPVHSKSENPFSARIRSGSASSISLRNPTIRSPSRQSNNIASRSSRPSSPVNVTTSATAQKFKSHPTQSPRLRRIDEPSHATTSSVNTSHNLPTPAPSPPPDDNGLGDEEEGAPAPFYISPFHRPSTNPAFTSLDVNRDFAPWADLGAYRFRASLWGKKGSDWGKGKNTVSNPEESPLYSSLLEEKHKQEQEWEVIASWDVDMDDLVPLSAEEMAQSSLLPSNTLIVSLAPHGDFFYVPTPQTGEDNRRLSGREDSRPPSPSLGYSDTELNYTNSDTAKGLKGARRRSSLPLRADVVNKSIRETKMKKSAGFGDLLNLVTLQSVIADTRAQLDEIIETCDRLLDENKLPGLHRELSQRQEIIRQKDEELQALQIRNTEVGVSIEERRAKLQARRERLEAARQIHKTEITALGIYKEQAKEESARHTTLMAQLSPVRATLLQTVSSIFPIEPIEPKDLLFGILSVPLPIPVGANDPAPPLTLPGDSSYNDETMATALGYVAQVLNLITAYLGDLPVYPVVCQGSRSLIRDPISAMMGPRSFPLYSRGVDTYRFEYGVFLLNKSLELLMSERNLPALDLRHTLPNLKNLLLTLTSGETVVLKPRPRRKILVASPSIIQSTASSISVSNPPTPDLTSPSPAPSDQSETHSTHIEHQLPTTPTASKIVIESDESDEPPAPSSVASTSTAIPTESSSTIKKSFYSPLATFLRARYPSVRAPRNPTPPPLNVKVEMETPKEPSVCQPEAERQPSETEEFGQIDADETSTIKGSFRSIFGRNTKKDIDISIST